MSTEAEIAVGKALQFELKWSGKFEDMSAAAQSDLIKRGMTIVRAYQSKAWREPTAEDFHERKPMLCTNSYMQAQDVWSPWRRPTITEWFQPSDQFDTVRVQDLPPLPEPKL